MWGLRQTNREDWKSWKTQIKYRFLRSMATRKRWRLTYAVIMVCYRQYTKLRSGGGCWFCPWAGKKELKSLRENHRDLWDWLIKLENEPDVINTNWNNLLKRKITENEELFFWEDAQVSIFDFPECIPDSMKNQERRND